MKKTLFKWLSIFVMAVVCVGFASCGDDDKIEDEQSLSTILCASKWLDRDGKDIMVTSYGGSISNGLYTLYFQPNNQGYMRWYSGEYDSYSGRSRSDGWVSFNYYVTSNNSVKLVSFSNGSSDLFFTYANNSLISNSGGLIFERMDIPADDEIYDYLREVKKQTDAKQKCPDSSHPHMINLGLPSGTLWACCNIGASKPEECGGYYAWGEVYTRSTYDLDSYMYYKNNSYVSIGNDIAGTQYDVASSDWYSFNHYTMEVVRVWQMPTYSQCQELIENTTSKWTTQNGVNGYLFKGKNGGSIFLPATGYRSDNKLESADTYGSYWSSSQYLGNKRYAYYFKFNKDYNLNGINMGGASTSYSYRYLGRCVRPVSK